MFILFQVQLQKSETFPENFPDFPEIFKRTEIFWETI